MPINAFQQRFVDEYMADPTFASRAYIRAGGSPKSAKPNSSRLLKHPKIKEAIARQQERLREQYQFSRDDLYHDLRGIVHSSESTASEKLKAAGLLCKLFGLI